MALTYAYQHKDDQPALAPVFTASAGAGYAYALLNSAEDASNDGTLFLDAGQTSTHDRIVNLTSQGQISQAADLLLAASINDDGPTAALADLAIQLCDRAEELYYPEIDTLKRDFVDQGIDLPSSEPELEVVAPRVQDPYLTVGPRLI